MRSRTQPPRTPRARGAPGRREPSQGGLALLFTGPALLVIAVTILFPLGYAIFVSLHRYNLKFPVRPFIGFDNYVNQLTGFAFWRSLGTTAVFSVGAVLTIIVLGMAIATLLDQKF